MSYKIGDKLYLYIVRGGKFRVHEGEVTMSRYARWNRPVVMFFDTHAREQIPEDCDIGVIKTGQRLWLKERDDALAKRLFIEYEKGRLAELEKQIERKKELIRVLEEDK